MQAAGVASALAALESRHSDGDDGASPPSAAASPPPPLRALLSGPAGPAPVLAAVGTSLRAFGETFAARASAAGAATAALVHLRRSSPGVYAALSCSMGGTPCGGGSGSSACCPATPTLPGGAAPLRGGRASTDDDASSCGPSSSAATPAASPASRAAAVEEVRARLHAMASPDGPQGQHPRTPGRVRTRLPEAPGAPAWA